MGVKAGTEPTSAAAAASILRRVIGMVSWLLISGLIFVSLMVLAGQLIRQRDAITVGNVGDALRSFGSYPATWIVAVGLVVVGWWALSRARFWKRATLRGVLFTLLSLGFYLSVIGLILFALIVVTGALNQEFTELRLPRVLLYLGANIVLLTAFRTGYRRLA
jgi:hypothetical protein